MCSKKIKVPTLIYVATVLATLSVRSQPTAADIWHFTTHGFMIALLFVLLLDLYNQIIDQSLVNES